MVAWRLARRTTRGARWFCIAAATGLLGLPPVALGAALLVNGAFNPATPAEHIVLVVDRDQRKHRYVSVQDWREGHPGAREVKIEWDHWDAMEVGAPVAVVIGRGRLGWPYWINVRPASHPR